MKKHFLLAFVCTCLVGVAAFGIVFAQDYGLGDTATAAGLTSGGKTLPEVVGSVIGTALSMVGVLFFGLMIYGGILWMTARGNDSQTEKAKNTMTAAVIGMIIILSSYAITSFVFKSVGNINQPSSGSGSGAPLGSGGGTTVVVGCGNTSDIACQGKSQGDTCTFDQREGTCRSDANSVGSCICQFQVRYECRERSDSPCKNYQNEGMCIGDVDCDWSLGECVDKVRCDVQPPETCLVGRGEQVCELVEA